MYTIETLKAINESYNSQHRVTQSDVDKANMYVSIIESSRNDSQIQPGDIVELTTKHGDYYRNAHIEGCNRDSGEWEVCERPHVPFIGLNDQKNNIWCSTSGGAWNAVPDGLKLIGKRLKTFCDWGHCGATANGAIEFQATVNVWEYIEPEQKYEGYSTKEWSKQYISHNPNMEDSRYTYFGNGIAFTDKEDYSKWLTTYRAVEFAGNWPNQTVVFGYREYSHLISREEWDALDLPLDTRLCNGVNICKVKYDHESHRIDVYRFSNSGTLDWRKYSAYELAKGTNLEGAY